MSESRSLPERGGQVFEEDAAASSGFLFEGAETLKNWNSDSLEELITYFNNPEGDTEHRLHTFTRLFETQTGRSLKPKELGYLAKKLANAERWISETKEARHFDSGLRLPIEFRKNVADIIDKRVKDGDKTAAFFEAQLIERAKQALDLSYRYVLVTTPRDSWEELLEY